MKKLIVGLCILSTLVLFAEENGRGPKGDMGEPPAEAITICKDKAENSTCNMSTPEGKSLEGKCLYTPDKKYFACVPNGHKPPQKN